MLKTLTQGGKVAFRSVIRQRGWDLVKTPTLHSFLASREVDLVIDVGANDGGYGKHLRKWGYKGRVLSLEPTTQAFAALSDAARADALWQVRKVAAGAEPGNAVINVSRNSEFSSFRTASAAGYDFDPAIEIASTESVEIVPLDGLEIEASRPFLKIDTQGFEEEILKGATNLLKRCAGVQLELPVEHLYEGVWAFEEAIAAMRRYGFSIAQMTPTNPRHPDLASAVEFDCIFRRT